MVELRLMEVAYRVDGALKTKDVLQFKMYVDYSKGGGGGTAVNGPTSYWTEWKNVPRVSLEDQEVSYE